MVAFTLAEASTVLDPPLSERQLRQIVVALGWKPDGHRRDGRAGRPHATYHAARLMGLHKAIAPFLEIPHA